MVCSQFLMNTTARRSCRIEIMDFIFGIHWMLSS